MADRFDKVPLHQPGVGTHREAPMIGDCMSNDERPDTHDTAPVMVDHLMVDATGSKIGKVTDVIYDEQGLARSPRWAIVDKGMFHAEHVVPLQGAYRDAEGRLVTPFDRALIDAAPKAPKDHIITPEMERMVRTHYGVSVTS
jgi:hypothetical protein